MKYRLAGLASLNEKGKRPYNEDMLFPHPDRISIDDRMFMVCDGVGGTSKGEQASRLVCEHFSNYLSQYTQALQNERIVLEALRYTEKKLDEYVAQHPEATGMATTLTYLYLSEFGAVICWAGDSRVYQFRNGAVKFQTKDHSIVNSLIAMGEITEEEAKVHPQRNIITRAISGSESPSKLDMVVIDDIEPGDYFLLCSDGVIEAFDSRELAQLTGTGASVAQINTTIQTGCAARSNDNYTQILLQVEDVQIEDLREATLTTAVAEETVTAKASSSRIYKFLIPILLLLIAFLFLITFGREWWSQKKETTYISHLGNGAIFLQNIDEKIIIDAYMAEAEDRSNILNKNLKKLNRGKAPFDDIDYLFLTYHPVEESWSREVEEFHQSHKSSEIIGPSSLQKSLRRTNAPFEKKYTPIYQTNRLDSLIKIIFLPEYYPNRQARQQYAIAIRSPHGRLLFISSPYAKLKDLKDDLRIAKLGIFISEAVLTKKENVSILEQLDNPEIDVLPSSSISLTIEQKEELKKKFEKIHFIDNRKWTRGF